MNRNLRIFLAVIILVVVLPAWVVIAVSLMEWADARFGPLNFWLELVGWVLLGIVWVFPLRRFFLGVSARGSAPRRFEDDP